MIKLYLKQAWTLIKQHRLFTGIYVVGTGLSIALVMTMFIIFYVKFAPIYPEYNRNRMIVLKMMKSYPKDDDKSWNCSSVSYDVVKMLQELPHLDAIGAASGSYREYYVEVPDNNEPIGITPLYADAGFWQVFTFRFLYGKPFTQADIDAKRREVVVPVSLARRLFAADDVVGRRFKMDAQEYRVCGVVEDVSAATPSTVGDLWMPITLNSWIKSDNSEKLVGSADIYMTAPTATDKEALKEEVREVFRKFNLAAPKYMNDLMGQPDDYWASTFRVNSCGAPDLASELRGYLYMLLAFHPCHEPERHDVFAHGRTPFRVGSTQNIRCYQRKPHKASVVGESSAHLYRWFAWLANFLSDSADGKRLDTDPVRQLYGCWEDSFPLV